MTDTIDDGLLAPDVMASDSDFGDALWSADSAILDLLPVGVYFCDAEGRVLRWNRAAVVVWGREPVVGDPGDRYCGSHRLHRNGQHVPHAECPMAVALRTGEPQRDSDLVIERPDQSMRSVSVTIDPIRDAEGTLVGAVNVVQDITERRRTEIALLDAERRFRQFLRKLPAAAYTCDADGLVTYFNDRAEELWGRRPVLNDTIDRFCGSFRLFSTNGDPIPHDRCWMAVSIRERRDIDGEEIVVERPDGSRRTALAYATPFHTEQGELAGAVNVLVDVSEQAENRERIAELLRIEREQSEQLRDADRRKDEFLAMLGHELRNPLAPIRSGLDVLQLDAEQHQDVIKLMQEQVEHVVRLVDDLLDVARVMQGRIEIERKAVDLAAIVRRSVNTVGRMIASRGQRLGVSLPDEPIWLWGDSVRLAQVVENLLTNASKYTDRDGSIELEARTSENGVELIVRDSGVGIEPDLLPHVFDLFTQSTRSLDRSDGGLGIGLTLVQRLIRLHGGTVSVHSDGPGHGSTFLVQLPASDEPREAVPVVECGTAISSKSPEEGRPLRILVVEDNEATSWLLSKLLDKLGHHEIATVGDGPTAIEKFGEFDPQLVILDIGLPGMSGYEVGRSLRERSQGDDLLIVALTGYGQEEDRRRSSEAGFDAHLVKPPSLEQMRQLLAHPKLTRS